MAISKERWSINISYIYEKNLENKYFWRHFSGSQYCLNEMKHFGNSTWQIEYTNKML